MRLNWPVANAMFDGFRLLHLVVFLAGAFGFLQFWKRTRFWLPTYVHVFGVMGPVIGIWIATSLSTDAPAAHKGPIIRVLLALVVPAMV